MKFFVAVAVLCFASVAQAQNRSSAARRNRSQSEAVRLLFGSQGIPALTRPSDPWNVNRGRIYGSYNPSYQHRYNSYNIPTIGYGTYGYNPSYQHRYNSYNIPSINYGNYGNYGNYNPSYQHRYRIGY